jgi:hypothetical protein
MPFHRAQFTACLTLAGALILLASVAVSAEVDPFTGSALRGVARIHVRVDGILDKFARYGLTAEKLRSETERRLSDYGIEVVDASTAAVDAATSQISIKLYANEDTYSNVSYRISVVLQRKVPLDQSGQAFTPETVWSKGQNGLLNPSDLQRIYGYAGIIVEDFLAEHSRNNSNTNALLEQ